MTDALDIASLPWERRASYEWTTVAHRAFAVAFLDGFVEGRNWACRWSVVESVLDNGINVKVPFGETGPPAPVRFRKRPGLSLLTVRIETVRGTTIEVGLVFSEGEDTQLGEISDKLALASQSLDATYRLAVVE